MPTDNPIKPNAPTFSTIDLAAETRRLWGADWGRPETSYEFADGKRKFELRTGDAAIYASSPDFTD